MSDDVCKRTECVVLRVDDGVIVVVVVPEEYSISLLLHTLNHTFSLLYIRTGSTYMCITIH